MTSSATAVPTPLKLALAGVLAEALVLVAAAATFLAGAVAAGIGAQGVGRAVPLAVLLVGFAALLGGAARAQWRGMRWGRGPVITWQLLQVVVAVALAPGLSPMLVATVVLLSAAVATGVLWPSSRAYAATTRSPDAVV
ncbi:hypothetical protein [Georgenia deserti]|uniref:Histidine kinase n=1 Tax=Georgenia deserti TaxID=2093781 RepID=A0ABW4L1E8_9MICO